MAYDGWLEFGGVEIVNVSRIAQLAETLGIDVVWVTPESVQWIQDALGGVDYDLISNAPWYDPDFQPSAEFAGIMPLSIGGMDSSTAESRPVEYVTDGGNSGRLRSATLPLVGNVGIVASTDRGAEFGKRWLDRVLRGSTDAFCSGSELRYFRYDQRLDAEAPPIAHRRDVSLTRGTSVTRKTVTHCSSTWLATFTLTADDPYEYGDEVPQFTELGGAVTGPGVESSGSLVLVEQSCPVYDYSPIQDPLFSSLTPAPSPPEFYPAGWDLEEGYTFDRFWARISSVEPSSLNVVPVLILDATDAARMVRFQVWPSDATTDERCDPLWTVIVSYLPPNTDFYVDGERKAAYLWNSFGDAVRRTDSLVYDADAEPIQWPAFNDPGGLLVTLDIFTGSGSGAGGDSGVRAALSLVPKSD